MARDSAGHSQTLRPEPRSSTVQVNFETDPARLGLYDRFMQATHWVPLAKFQLIWDFIRSIEEPPTGELKRSMLPPADSELWHDDEEPKLLLEGETKT